MLGATLVHEPQQPLQILHMNRTDNEYNLPISHVIFNRDKEKWRDEAACKDIPIETFFPTKGASQKKVQQAKAICNICPVKQDCYEWAIQFPERLLMGIWGGTTGKDRRAIRKRLGLKDHDTRLDD